jgi:hypothetical protein
MKKKTERFARGVAMFALAAVLVVSVVALTGHATDEDKPEITASVKGDVSPVTGPGRPATLSTDPIIWNNGGSNAGYFLASSQQNDAVYPFVSQTADDFMFTEDMDVTDVHWWGGFWNGPPDEIEPCPFYIYFYADDGTGNAPTGGGMADPAPTALASYYFPAVSGLPLDPNGYHEYDVDLSPPFSAAAGVKYWIAIQADFAYPPQWGWTDTDGIQLHSATQGFPFLGMPFWTDVDPAVDMAYYLTGLPSGPPWPNHKMHFPQLPDLIGWDVYAGAPQVLSDDWQCSETGYVLDIHFWGSWRNIDGDPWTDDFFTPMPYFYLFIHRNIPAGVDTPWSRPGEVLWGWQGEIGGFPSEPPTMESWFDPNTGELICNDHVPYWRYDFFIDQANPPADTFIQYKDSIYWLTVATQFDMPPPYQWGWKNSRDHFMDDAVWSLDPFIGPWLPIIEPPRCNWFDVYFDGTGLPNDMGSTNYYGHGWYFYEMYDWWNMWFYDNPFTYEHPKEITLDFFVEPVGPQSFVEFAINWSTDIWSMEGEPDRPPLPGEDEDLYIGREILPVVFGPNTIQYTIPYNPEWISIDFRAVDVIINGWIYHECVPTSMDMAFVITGEPLPYICGDANGDGVVGPGDVVFLLNYLFIPGSPAPSPMAAGDVNCDGAVNAADVVYLLNWLFRNGPWPCDPDGDGIPDC